MKKLAICFFLLLFAAPASAQTINSLGAGTTVQGTDLLPVYQGANPAVKVTADQLKTYMAQTVTTSLQTGSNYAFVTGDRAKAVYLSNAAAQAPTVPQAGTTGFEAGWFVTTCNIAAGIQTITPTTSTIGGAASLALAGGSAISPRCVSFISDGSNYLIVPSGNAYTISSGTSALGTSAISSAACATVVTTSAPGVVTTDIVQASFNGDPTAVTGYIADTAGMLTIIGYPSANNVNFKVCNNTLSSITPGAITLNWRVVR